MTQPTLVCCSLKILLAAVTCLPPSLQASLVAADRLWQSKREILDSVGFDTPQEFPISADGMPQQLLSYLRLSTLAECC